LPLLGLHTNLQPDTTDEIRSDTGIIQISVIPVQTIHIFGGSITLSDPMWFQKAHMAGTAASPSSLEFH
jgi:hypothetical protein